MTEKRLHAAAVDLKLQNMKIFCILSN